MIRRLESKHWLLIGAFLTATSTMISGLQHWGDITPLFVAGLLAQIGTLIGAIFQGAPVNPRTRHRRRRTDRDHVSDETRRNL